MIMTLILQIVMVQVKSDLVNFIIDLEDEECPNYSLHLAAYQSDLTQLELLLNDSTANIDSRIRPFLATPLRLAATGATGVFD